MQILKLTDLNHKTQRKCCFLGNSLQNTQYNLSKAFNDTYASTLSEGFRTTPSNKVIKNILTSPLKPDKENKIGDFTNPAAAGNQETLNTACTQACTFTRTHVGDTIYSPTSSVTLFH